MPKRADREKNPPYLKKQRFKNKQGKWQKGHTWYFVMAVPLALRGKFLSSGRNGEPGKPLTKIVKKLGTDSLSEAQKRREPLVAEWRATFRRVASGEPLSPAEVAEEAREVYTATLQRMETEAKLGSSYLRTDGKRHRTPPQPVQEQIESLGIVLHNYFDAVVPFPDENENPIDLERHIERLTDFDLVGDELAAVQRRKGVTLELGSPTYNLLGRAIVRAKIDALDGRLKMLKGEPSEPPPNFLGPAGVDPLTLRPIAPQRPQQIRIRDGEGMRFSEAASLYMHQMQRDPNAKLSEHTRQQSESVFELFQNFTGDAPITNIGKSTAANFLDLVAQLDPHWNHEKDAKKLPLVELVEKRAGAPGRLSNRTINRYISSLSSVFKWADKRSDDDVRNPFRGQSREQSTGTGWRAYTVDELNKLFGSKLYKETTAAERIRPNANTFKTAMLWVPLIGLYSGMRSNEICQLQVSDIVRKNGVWAFRVSAEGEGQSVKSEAAVRIVPVHSELVRCGFLDYLKTLSPEGRLFPALKPGGADGKFNWYFSKRFTVYRRSCGVNAPRVSFHSFRKNAAQALKDGRSTQAEIAELIGHEQGFTNKFYTPLQLPMPALKELIERIGYDGLKLSHL
jgi:integrase